MSSPSRIIRAVRTNGTKETKLTIGEFRTTIDEFELTNLLKDCFEAKWGITFNEEALRRK